MQTIFGGLFGSGRNVVAETAEVFRPNAERSAQRAADYAIGAQGQFAAEFAAPERKGWFNALVDGLNRLPRPAMAYGTIGLFVYAMQDPVGFAERMVGLAAVPDQLWWLLGAVVGFYFGAREMSHMRAAAPTPQAVREIVANIEEIRTLRPDSVRVAEDDTDLEAGQGDNPALEAWKASADDGN